MLSLRFLAALFLTTSLAPLAGCTMCPSPDTEAYPTYGGIWQRTDRYHGRVGSVFEPAGVKVARAAEQESLLAPELVPPGEPTPADEPPGAADDADVRAGDDAGDAQRPDADAPQERDLDQEMEELRRRLDQRPDVEEVQL